MLGSQVHATTPHLPPPLNISRHNFILDIVLYIVLNNTSQVITCHKEGNNFWKQFTKCVLCFHSFASQSSSNKLMWVTSWGDMHKCLCPPDKQRHQTKEAVPPKSSLANQFELMERSERLLPGTQVTWAAASLPSPPQPGWWLTVAASMNSLYSLQARTPSSLSS